MAHTHTHTRVHALQSKFPASCPFLLMAHVIPFVEVVDDKGPFLLVKI